MVAVSALVRNTSRTKGCNTCSWALLGTRHYCNYCVLRTPYTGDRSIPRPRRFGRFCLPGSLFRNVGVGMRIRAGACVYVLAMCYVLCAMRTVSSSLQQPDYEYNCKDRPLSHGNAFCISICLAPSPPSWSMPNELCSP